MTNVVIRTQRLSKCFHIYATPRDRLKQFMMPRARRMLGLRNVDYYREFWAVRDVSLEIRQGETVGIIGRNGSGKSTLLQLICGTLTPTHGELQTQGRIAALLELGSGFNPEFSGRENVYLNGALLGLSRAEIDRRLPAIFEFADIGEFVDQPVKTYSSGMFVRLAFAVVAHCDPEILVIDEALSVGDAFFQSKCAAAMRALIDQGTTILFVSHDTHAVKSLCDRAILMENGTIVAQGDPASVVESYYSRRISTRPSAAGTVVTSTVAVSLEHYARFAQQAAYQRVSNGRARFLDATLLDEHGNELDEVRFKQKVILQMVVAADCDLPILGLAYHIRDMKGVELVYSDTGIEDDSHIRKFHQGEVRVARWAFRMSLHEGDYNISCMASVPVDLSKGEVEVCDFVPFALQFRVTRGDSLPIYAAVHWDNTLKITRAANHA